MRENLAKLSDEDKIMNLFKMIEADMEKASDPENKARLEATLSDLRKAQEQVAQDAIKNERKTI